MFGSTVLGGGHGYAGIMTEEREHDGALDTVGSVLPVMPFRRNAASGPRETESSKTTRSPRRTIAAAKEMRRWFEGDQLPSR
jgi:hypothetical protein